MRHTTKPKRELRDFLDGEWIIVAEREAYHVPGYVQRRWNEQRVSLTMDELRALAAKYLGADEHKPVCRRKALEFRRLVTEGPPEEGKATK